MRNSAIIHQQKEKKDNRTVSSSTPKPIIAVTASRMLLCAVKAIQDRSPDLDVVNAAITTPHLTH
jgi:hypothetical protein